MHNPSRRSLALGLIPFIGMCFTVSLWDRITPMIFGLPFNLFWLLAWIVVSSLCLALANRIETQEDRKGRE